MPYYGYGKVVQGYFEHFDVQIRLKLSIDLNEFNSFKQQMILFVYISKYFLFFIKKKFISNRPTV